MAQYRVAKSRVVEPRVVEPRVVEPRVVESRVVAVLGPTASGKTGLGVALAQAIGGEVVNADSMQLYAGMDVGTAKATTVERAGVTHHLLDIWSPLRAASVAAYRDLARDTIDGLLARGISAVIVGGSGLYVRAVLDDLEFPGTDPDVRARLVAQTAELGSPAMHGRLATLDPVAAAAVHPGNERKIVRALEVIELTGRPFSASLPTYGVARWGAVQLGLEPSTQILNDRIASRVQRMWALGLVDEVRRLAADPGLGVTARRALGYAQVLGWLEAGAPPEAEAGVRESTVFATRRFARRQRSWFRRDPRIAWLPTAELEASYADGPGVLLETALKRLHPDAAPHWS